MEAVTREIRFEEGGGEVLPVTSFGGGRYGSRGAPLLFDGACFGDTIEADEDGAGRLSFCRVVGPTPYRTWSWMVSRVTAESGELRAFLSEVERSGGRWERVAGSRLLVHLPRNAAFDPEAAWQRALGAP